MESVAGVRGLVHHPSWRDESDAVEATRGVVVALVLDGDPLPTVVHRGGVVWRRVVGVVAADSPEIARTRAVLDAEVLFTTQAASLQREKERGKVSTEMWVECMPEVLCGHGKGLPMGRLTAVGTAWNGRMHWERGAGRRAGAARRAEGEGSIGPWLSAKRWACTLPGGIGECCTVGMTGV